MTDIHVLAKTCWKLVHDCDEIADHLPELSSFKFIVNSRAQNRWGLCRWHGGTKFEIEISNRLLESTEGYNGAVNTMIHELLHACAPGAGHKGNWKKFAEIIFKRYGIDIKRTSSSADKGLSSSEESFRKLNYKYRIECVCCGQTTYRTKMSSIVKHPEEWNCGKCGGSLKVFTM